MGKVKTVIMGDEIAEETARKKAEVKREQKKIAKGFAPTGEYSAKDEKSDKQRSADILKMMAEEKPAVDEKAQLPEEKVNKIEVKEEVKEAKKKKIPKVAEEAVKAKHGKKYLEKRAIVEKNKLYTLVQAIDLVKKSSFSKFDGSIEAHINVAEKGLRGTVQMPHGVGKKVRVAIADDALIEEVAAGKINFDVLVAHPQMMAKLAKVAKILGPKGLMPNPKTGTIGNDPEEIVKKLSAGQTNWKTETDFPIVHLVLGKVSFDSKKIEENYLVLAKSIGKDKVKSVFLKATMGPSVKVQI